MKRPFAALLIVALCFAICCSSVRHDRCSELSEQAISKDILRNLTSKDLLDCGNFLEPGIERLFSDTKDPEIINSALYSFMIIGDSRSKEILQYLSDFEGSSQANEYYCTLLGNNPSQNEIDYLINDVQQDWDYPKRIPSLNAPLSLGILRSPDYISALKICIEKHSNRITGQNARSALRWIEMPPALVKTKGEYSDDQLIISILQNGIPRVDSDQELFETRAVRKWKYGDNAWSLEKVPFNKAKSFPSIQFDVVKSSDNIRAIVEVGLSFAPLNESGYTYLLRFLDGRWKVVGICYSWTS